jgi:F-type H+-transporting ATPase subunit gamma
MSEIAAIKRRLAAISQTRQITNAMYLISSSIMRSEAKRVSYASNYFFTIRRTVREIIESSSDITKGHPFFEHRPGDRAAFLVIAGDKGLCGSYNDDLLKFALNKIQAHKAHYVATVGRMATEFFTRRGLAPDTEMLGAAQDPSLHSARMIVEDFLNLYDANKIDEVWLVFTRFRSFSYTYPLSIRLLPLGKDISRSDEKFVHRNLLYAPSPEAVFVELLPQLAVGLVFSALVQSTASEAAARMNAMQSATKNADAITERLRREYHTQRQLSITNEIIEITAGAAGAVNYAAKGSAKE